MLWLLIIFVFTLIYVVINQNFKYWKNRNVPGPKPSFLVGNLLQNILMTKSFGFIVKDIYNEYAGYPFVGIYKALTPALIVRDPDFIKKIIVKDFKHFHDNDVHVDKKLDPIFGRNPLVLRGAEWKTVRSLITPCFTSGKMKILFPFIEETCKKMINYINNQNMSPNGLEAKELCIKFTIDNVASCAFGLEGKCFENPNSEFRDLAQNFLAPGSWESIKFMFLFVWPNIYKYIPIKFVSSDVEERLRSMIHQTLQYREETNIVRHDFLHFVNELKKANKDGTFTEEDVTAQAATFFNDGYETSSIVLSFVIFELGCNPDAQTKLRNEIQDKLEKSNGELTYEMLHEMHYLDACINESMRKNPAILFIGKTCTERYTYKTTDSDKFEDLTITVEPGMSIILPTAGLHMDPKYFPEPEKYEPDRFLTKNKNNVNRYTFLPFGLGPRICLGLRFGLMQVKLGVVHLVKNFKITLNKNTKLPLEFDPIYLLLSPKDGLWLNFEKIQ